MIAIIAILIALLLPAVQQAREAARRSTCKNSLKQIGLAMHNYHETHRVFPPGYIAPGDGCDDVTPGGNILNHTGMQMILPFLDQAPLYQNYNFEIASGESLYNNNSKCTQPVPTGNQFGVAPSAIPIFMCPSDPGPEKGVHNYAYAKNTGAHRTSYGFAALHDDARTQSWAQESRTTKGVFGYNGAARMRDITDGTSNTMAIVETRLDKDSGEDWNGPFWDTYSYPSWMNLTRGLNTDSLPATSGINLGRNSAASNHVGGVHILLCDGAVRFLSENADQTGVLNRLVTVSGNDLVGEF